MTEPGKRTILELDMGIMEGEGQAPVSDTVGLPESPISIEFFIRYPIPHLDPDYIAFAETNRARWDLVRYLKTVGQQFLNKHRRTPRKS